MMHPIARHARRKWASSAGIQSLGAHKALRLGLTTTGMLRVAPVPILESVPLVGVLRRERNQLSALGNVPRQEGWSPTRDPVPLHDVQVQLCPLRLGLWSVGFWDFLFLHACPVYHFRSANHLHLSVHQASATESIFTIGLFIVFSERLLLFLWDGVLHHTLPSR